MPIVNFYKREVDRKLGDLSIDEFESLCFDYGLELDEVTSEYDMVCKEQGEEKACDLSKDLIYKVEVPANRYDLLCVEGIIRALCIFREKIKAPLYELFPKKSTILINVEKEITNIRPFVVGAVLRNVTFNTNNYDSFIQLQDKLHVGVGRQRTLMSIGTHDLDTLTPPFFYRARKPEDIKFIPLNETHEFRADELMVYYEQSKHLKRYLSIIKDSEVYPVIEDSNGVICSLPPIINGHHSRIKLSTQNIFIEITATCKEKAKISLDTMVTMFSEYCQHPYQIEPVDIVTSDTGSREQYPELNYRTETISTDYIVKRTGIQLKTVEVGKLLEKMGLSISTMEETQGLLQVDVPPVRHDIIHQCDIVEDVLIAYGYDNVPIKKIEFNTIGSLTPLTELTSEISFSLINLGINQALTFVLCSIDDVSTSLNKQLEDVAPVEISNPKTKEFQVGRTTLIPGLLHTVKNNQHLPLPLKFFEVQDVVLRDPTTETGARNERRACVVYYGQDPDLLFEEMVSIFCTLMDSLNGVFEPESSGIEDSDFLYRLDDVEDASYVKNASFDVMMIKKGENPVLIGKLGLLRPDVLKNFKIKKHFIGVFEIKVEQFL